MNINISGEVVRTSQLPKRIIGLGDYLVALNSSPLETSTVLVSDFVSFLNTQFATSLASLTDVSINGPLPGQALVFNGSYWVNQNLVSSLAGLSDVTIASLNPNQLLRYDGTSWKNWTPTFYSLPAGGTTLQYIDGTGALQTLPTSLPTSTVRHQVKAGVPITKGQAVYVTSADGTNMIVGLASNASEATSSKTMGLLDATVSTNGFANVVTEGLLTGLDTTGANASGDPVWLGTNGNLIYGLVNKPYAPNHLVFIGIVTRRNANNGEIFVKVQNGFELDELHNVDARNPSNNDGIFYNSTTQLWEHKQISAVAPTPTLDQVTTAGNTTTNAITVGSVNSNGNVVIGGATSSGAFQSYNGYYAFSFGSSTSAYNPNNNYTRIHMGASITYTDNFSGNFLWRSAGASVFEVGNASVNFYNTSSTAVSRHNASTGNFLIGTTTDAGYKLDINGTFRTLVGTETNPFRLEHTNGNYMTMVVGAGSALAAGQFGMYFNGSPMWSWNGTVFRLHGNTISTATNPSTLVVQGGYGGSTVGTSIRLSSNTPNQGQWTATTGAQITVEVGNHSNETWAPSSGNASYTTLSIAPRINTSGTYAGIVTGFAYNPTLTSVTGVTHRAIHTVTGDVLLGTTSGNVGVGTTSPTYKLDVLGGIRSTYLTTSVVHGEGNTLLLLSGLNGANPGVNEARLHLGYNQNDPVVRLNSNGVSVSTGTWFFLPQTWFAGGITSNHNSALTIDGMSNGVTSGVASEIIRFTQRNGQFANFYDAGAGLSEFRIWQQANSNNYIYLKPGQTSYFSTGSLVIGGTTDAGYKLDVNGTARVLTRIDAGSFTPGAGASAYTFATMGQITAAGGYNLRPPTVGDSGFSGLGDSGGPTIYSNNATVARFQNIGGALNGTSIDILQSYNPGAGTGNVVAVKHSYSLYPSADNTVSYTSFYVNPNWNSAPFYNRITGPIRGFHFVNGLYNTQKLIDVIAFESNGGRVVFAGETPSASGGVSRGVYLNQTLTAAANNDVLVGLDINPTFTNGAFTGVKNIGLRVPSNVLIGGTTYYTQTNTGQPITSALQINGNISLISSSTTDRFNLIGSDPSTFWQARLDGAYGLSTIIGINSLSQNYNGTISPAIVTGLGMEIAGTLAVQTRIATKGPVTLDGSTNRYIRFWEPGVAKRAVIGHTDSADGGHIVIRTGDATTLADGTQAVRVFQTTQNVLIGSSTTDAGYKLDVNGTGRFSGNLEVNAGNNGQIFINNVYPRLLFGKTGTPSWSIGADTENSGQFEIGTGAGFPYNTFTSRVYISTAGNVGIGTTTPVSKLNVYGGDIISSSATANRTTKLNDTGLYLSRTSDGTYPCSITGDGGMIYDARNNHTFRSDTVTLLDVGNAYQNVTIGASQTSGARLVVKGSGSTSATSSLLIQNSGGTTAFQVKDNLQVDFGGIVRLTNGDVYVNLTSPSSDAFATGVFGSLNFYVNAGGRTKSNRILAEDINGIGTLDNSAILQANSTTQGFLPPRLTTAQILAIASPAEGLQVYNTDLKTICFYNGTAWQRVTSTAM